MAARCRMSDHTIEHCGGARGSYGDGSGTGSVGVNGANCSSFGTASAFAITSQVFKSRNLCMV